MHGGDGGGKLYLLLLKLIKLKKAQFWAKCLNSFCRRLQARQHDTEAGKGQSVPEQTIFRKRIDQGKVDHFISYISQPQLHQDVAFGTKTLKLDSGERIIIPAVVRTLIPSRIIEQYTSYCKEQQFEPASIRCLFRMLEVCSASMQRSLHGLDNITAEGTEAFDNLRAIIDT